MTSPPSNPSVKTRPRWWPAVLLLGGAAALWIHTYGFSDLTGQHRFMRSVGIGLLTGLLLLLWLILLSRLPGRVRLTALGVLAVGIALALTTLRIDGVSGNLVPVLNWRWAPPVDEELLAELERVEPSRGAAEEPVSSPEADTTEPTIAEEPAEESAEGSDAATTEGTTAEAAEPEPEPRASEISAPAHPSHRPASQFLGPDRNATFPDVALHADWDEHPPREVWRRPIGAGWSSFAVADGLVITQEQRGDDELVTAYRLSDGDLVWGHAEDERYSTTVGGTGPRATPTVAGGRVYALGATGILTCLDLRTGRLLWKRDVTEGSDWQPDWGRSGSPLVLGDTVVVPAGGPGRALVAYDTRTGAPRWSAGDDNAGYSSPALLELAGTRQIVSFNQAGVTAHDPAEGRELWSLPWSRAQPNVAQPLPLGDDRLLISSGYGIGSELHRIRRDGDDWHTELVWKSPRLKAKFTNPVFHDGYVYGLDDGVLVCLDPATGERCWKRGRYGHGQVLLVGKHLVIQAEDGDLVLVEPNPQEHRELARIPALDGKTWNVPALAYPYLLTRNDQEVACYKFYDPEN